MTGISHDPIALLLRHTPFEGEGHERVQVSRSIRCALPCQATPCGQLFLPHIRVVGELFDDGSAAKYPGVSREPVQPRVRRRASAFRRPSRDPPFGAHGPQSWARAARVPLRGRRATRHGQDGAAGGDRTVRHTRASSSCAAMVRHRVTRPTNRRSAGRARGAADRHDETGSATHRARGLREGCACRCWRRGPIRWARCVQSWLTRFIRCSNTLPVSPPNGTAPS